MTTNAFIYVTKQGRAIVANATAPKGSGAADIFITDAKGGYVNINLPQQAVKNLIALLQEAVQL